MARELTSPTTSCRDNLTKNTWYLFINIKNNTLSRSTIIYIQRVLYNRLVMNT